MSTCSHSTLRSARRVAIAWLATKGAKAKASGTPSNAAILSALKAVDDPAFRDEIATWTKDDWPSNVRKVLRPITKVPQKKPIRKDRKDFYESKGWLSVRYQALKIHGRKCQCCGSTPDDGAVIHVDHIRPRSIYPELALDLNNLQILCKHCNLGKSNTDETDWRLISGYEMQSV